LITLHAPWCDTQSGHWSSQSSFIFVIPFPARITFHLCHISAIIVHLQNMIMNMKSVSEKLQVPDQDVGRLIMPDDT
jgi:hypothetical protein